MLRVDTHVGAVAHIHYNRAVVELADVRLNAKEARWRRLWFRVYGEGGVVGLVCRRADLHGIHPKTGLQRSPQTGALKELRF